MAERLQHDVDAPVVPQGGHVRVEQWQLGQGGQPVLLRSGAGVSEAGCFLPL